MLGGSESRVKRVLRLRAHYSLWCPSRQGEGIRHRQPGHQTGGYDSDRDESQPGLEAIDPTRSFPLSPAPGPSCQAGQSTRQE